MSPHSEKEQSVWRGSSQRKETKGIYMWKGAQPATRRSTKKYHTEESLHTVRFTKSNVKRSLTTQSTLQNNRNTNQCEYTKDKSALKIHLDLTALPVHRRGIHRQRAHCTMLFSILDLSIHRFWHPQGLPELILFNTEGWLSLKLEDAHLTTYRSTPGKL